MVNSIKRDRNPWTFCKLSTCQTQMLVSHVDLLTYIYLPTQYLFWRAFVLAHCTKHEGWSNNLDNPGSQHEHQVAWYTERFMQMHLGNPAKKRCADGSSWVTFPKQVARPSFGKSAPGAMQPRNFGEGPKKWLEARAKGMGSMLKGEKSAGIRWQNHRKNMEKHGDALVVVRIFYVLFLPLVSIKVLDLKGPLNQQIPRVVSSSTSTEVPGRDMSIGNEVSFSMIFSLCT